MKTSKMILPILAYAVSVYVSWKFCAGYWVVGPVFAAALIIANLDTVRKKFSLKPYGLVILSTLIYALVFWISEKGWRLQPEWLDMLAGSLSAGVILGSVLMPALHASLYGFEVKNAQITSAALIVSWYVCISLSLMKEYMGLRLPISEGLLAIALWQGIYLNRMKLK